MTLHEFNTLPREQLIELLGNCCGSKAWVNRMLPFIPAEDLVELLEDAEEQWWLCQESDWKEAFSHHPKIGDTLIKKNSTSAEWAIDEQAAVMKSTDDTLRELAAANKKYEDKFGYLFIVCATGKSGEEMLALLQTRLQNNPEVEIEIAADEQNKITKLRLEKLLQ
ncbi:MAG TPA: 2-oxo-4-hydroxy-4-carboxy-5-ureidoimidazoline decarboxylase [Chitinophagaceae bacterium]